MCLFSFSGFVGCSETTVAAVVGSNQSEHPTTTIYHILKQNAIRRRKKVELLTVKEVARRLKRAEYTIRAWLRAGKLKGIKIGNKDWRVSEDDLNDYLNHCKGD